MAQPPVVFADAVISVSLANGVVRIVLGSVDAENKLQPTGTLVMPFNQFGGTLHNLVNAVAVPMAVHAGGPIIAANEAFCRLVSRSREVLNELELCDLVGEADRAPRHLEAAHALAA